MREVIIVGAGASLKNGIEKNLWVKIKGKTIWSCNSIFKIMPYLPTRELWVDRKFFELTISELQVLGQKHKVELVAKKDPRYAIIPEIIQYEGSRLPETCSKEKKILYTGRIGLVGLFALSLAVYEDYERIWLLGFDFGPTSLTDTNTHVYQDKIKELNIYSTGAGRPVVYFRKDGKIKDEVNDFKFYLKDKEKIINVSPNSNIPFFEKIDCDTFFKRISE